MTLASDAAWRKLLLLLYIIMGVLGVIAGASKAESIPFLSAAWRNLLLLPSPLLLLLLLLFYTFLSMLE
jgi:predicted membrane channel-forming protein YqfA (hemolysin III family)